jgi:uncharacterized membrane protein YcaP (DUF421 family)
METVLRVVLVYSAILIGLRLIGKREFGQLSPIELVSLLLIPELVSQSVLGDDFSLTNGLIAVSTLLSLVFLTSLAMHLHGGLERTLSGAPTLLVAEGRLLEEQLDRERISPEELFNELHKAGLTRLDQVRWAILKVDGRIAIVPEKPGHLSVDDSRLPI